MLEAIARICKNLPSQWLEWCSQHYFLYFPAFSFLHSYCFIGFFFPSKLAMYPLINRTLIQHLLQFISLKDARSSQVGLHHGDKHLNASMILYIWDCVKLAWDVNWPKHCVRLPLIPRYLHQASWHSIRYWESSVRVLFYMVQTHLWQVCFLKPTI